MTAVADDVFVDEGVAETVPVPATRKRIYVYTVPGRQDRPWERTVGRTHTTGVGVLKVGETTKPTAAERIKQQLGTAYPGLTGVDIVLDEEAQRPDGSWFGDHAVHRALAAQGIRRVGGEWFEASLEEVKAAIVAVRNGTEFDSHRVDDFPMRPEQETAVALTAGYYTSHASDSKAPKFLWNAKMRFGKTFTSYQLAREMGWSRVLVLTYKPAVQAAWRDDLLSHVDFEAWHFVDRNTPIKQAANLADGTDPLVWFASFQDITGKAPDGKIKAHNETMHLIDWVRLPWSDRSRGLWDGVVEVAGLVDTASFLGEVMGPVLVEVAVAA